MEKRLFDETFLQNLERLAILTRKFTAGKTQGERRSVRRGQSIEFADYRPYATGDDFRRIDWNAYARLERFFVKLFIEEEDLTVHILIDTSRSMDWGEPNKLVYAARLAGAIGYITMVGLDRVTVTLLGQDNRRTNHYLVHLRGKKQAYELFEFLQLVKSAGRNPAHDLKEYAINTNNPGPTILISDLMDDGWMEGIHMLAMRGFEPVIIHLLSPDESNPSQFMEPQLFGDFKLLDSESHAEVEITSDFETLNIYNRQLREWHSSLQQFCIQRGAQYLPIVTTMPLETLLFRELREQGILR